MPKPPPGFELDPKETLPSGFDMDNAIEENQSEEASFPSELPSDEAEQTFKQKMIEHGQELAHQLGLTARWGAEGVAGAIGAFSDPPGQLMANALNRSYEPLREMVARKLTDVGVPEPRNKAEEVIGEITSLIAGAGTGAGIAGGIAKGTTGLTQKAAQAMAAQPGQQLTGAAGAGAGQQIAEEAGAGPIVQTAAGLAGGIAGARTAARRELVPKDIPAGMQAAEERGIKVLTADVSPPKTAVGRTFERAAVPMRSKQMEQRVDATKDFARQFGGEEVQPFIDDVFKELKNKWGFKLSRYSKLKKDVINKLDEKGTVPVEKTNAAIDNEIAILKNQAPSGANDSLINQLETFKTDIQNQGLVNIEAARKRLGNSLAKDPTMAHIKDQGEKISSGLYKKLNDDMGNFIKKTGEPKDFNKWKAGNTQIAKMNDDMRMQALRSVLKTGDKTPEDVRKLLFSTKPSMVRMLYKNLNPAGKRNARMSLIQEAVQKAGGFDELSPDRFKNQLKKLQPKTGIFFKGDEKQQLEGLYRALKFTEQGSKTLASPPTGVQNVPILVSILGAAIGGAGGSAIGAGPIGSALAASGAAALPLSINRASKIYNSRPVRNILLKIPKIKKGSKEEIALIKRLYVVMQDEYEKEESTQ